MHFTRKLWATSFLLKQRAKSMSGLEIIRFRTTATETSQILATLRHLLDQTKKEKSCDEIKMYQRTFVDTDLSIFIYHSNPMVEKGGSSLGLRITSALQEFGMVNHTTWSEFY